jgi:UrcA family protein
MVAPAAERDSKQEEATMKRPIIIALASGLITAAAIKATPALAQEAPVVETRTTVVHTADLNLGTKAGQRQLDRRLANAAREVCGEASAADLEGRNEVRHCIDATLASAKGQRDGLLAANGRAAVFLVSASR